MIRIKEIRIIGVTRLKVNMDVGNLEVFRKECADKYNVKLKDVKFIYEERE